MKDKKTLLIICAMGYATSSMIKKCILDDFDAHNITDWNVETTALNMSQGIVESADIIVSSLDLGAQHFSAPIIDGVPLISGIGKEETLAAIRNAMQQIPDATS